MGQMMSDDMNGERGRCPLCNAPVVITLDCDTDGMPVLCYDFDVTQYETFGTVNSIDYFVIE